MVLNKMSGIFNPNFQDLRCMQTLRNGFEQNEWGLEGTHPSEA